MEVTVENQELPDSKRIVRRFEDGVLVSEVHLETSSSGKQIQREFDGSGNLRKEMHTYGTLDMAIAYTFRDGEKKSEQYFRRRKLASRKTYEKARLRYPDMPPADEALPDKGAELLKLVAAERRSQAAARKLAVPDPKQAETIDAFCRKLMTKGTCLDAMLWIASSNHTLGEKDHRASVRLLKRLADLGALAIVACDIQSYGDEGENTGHLVLQLPKEASTRAKILKSLARLAQEQGYAGDPDDGQDYAYIKLD